MKKTTKQFISLFLALALIVTTFFAMPTTVSAASKPTSKKATLKITDTKISGFKKIEGTLSVNGKSVIAYGKNKKGQNVYAYSTNGKKFSKATLLGIEGEVDYRVSKNNIYVFAKNDKGYTTAYKYASNAKNLSSSPVINLTEKFSLPAGCSTDDLRCYSNSGTNGKFYMTAYYSGYVNGDYVSYDYSAVLNGNNVTVVNLTELIQNQMPNCDISYVDLSRDYASNSYNAVAYGTGWDKETYKRVSFIFKTSDGINFTPINAPYAYEDATYQYEWCNSKLFAYVNYYNYNNPNTAPMTSDNKGIFYTYSNGNWEQCTTSKACPTGFFMGYRADAYYNDGTSSKDFFVAQYNIENATQILYTANGKSWKSLPKLSYNKTAKSKSYQLSHVGFYKSSGGTYATETYNIPNKENQSYLVISKLSKNKWKTLKALTIARTTKSAYSTTLYGKNPALIYNNGKTTVGYNLSTKKSYKMPFKYTYNSIYSGDTSVYWQGKNLYVTRNGYKNVTKVTLKIGSKTLNTKITDNGYGYIKKTSYTYLICGGKMYYVPYAQLSKIK